MEGYGATSTPFGNTFAVIGGKSPEVHTSYNLIYIFDPVDWDWVRLDENMTEAKSEMTAIPVRESLFPPCE